ncbi:hypothetical protein K2P47_00120 [Patescibacteria group bacterium]|nr:hypothetical protein [Patescibacteria group bacterium]
MELLIKNIIDTTNPRNDNSDKKQLFTSGTFEIARNKRESWNFIKDEAISRNISYQMQYLEFQVRLYNDYQIYLTVESLMCKNIIVTIGGIIEAALFALMTEHAEGSGYQFDDRTPYFKRIDEAYDMQIIDRELKDTLHNLRKMRNLVHLNTLDYREYQAYDVEEANEYITALERFIQYQTTHAK